MKVVIAPDSFKGSLASQHIAACMERGVRRVFPAAEVVRVPIADGGEGTLDAAVEAAGGVVRCCIVSGPIAGHSVHARYGIIGGDTVLIETAEAAGLSLVREVDRNPLSATSRGVGELIKHALDQGFRRFVVGLGGSAVNDGGAGMLRALGWSLRDAAGRELPEGGAALRDVVSIDDAEADPRLADSSFIVLNDVDNPLCGKDGASAVFGPQKGATPSMVEMLDEALQHYAEVVKRMRGIDLQAIRGGGAAGGLGAAFAGLLGASMRPGIEWLMEAVSLDQELAECDLLLTGEGRLDSQTLNGKVIAGLCRAAARYQVSVIAVCGSVDLTDEQREHLGLTAAFSLTTGPCTLEQALDHTGEWLEACTANIMRVLHSGM